MNFVKQHMDVLQNIEFAIVEVYKENYELIDADVLFALDALIDFYTAEERNRPPRNFNLSEKSNLVYNNVKEMCEYRVGRNKSMDISSKNLIIEDKLIPVTLKDIQDCLKKIKTSVNKWTRMNGRQGYLEFVKNYVP
ncbi:MAG: hypothetical protein EHM58_16755 [Ignavibacteriae bacterium]|nr:MAG: hypothetical protein EHM58_16755 [Ignavibacteriota bacterium]